MHEQVAAFLRELDQAAAVSEVGPSFNPRPVSLGHLEQGDLSVLFTEITRREPLASAAQQRLLASLMEDLAGRFHPRQSAGKRSAVDSNLRERVSAVYRNLGANSRARRYILAMLAGSAKAEDLSLLAELIADDPPLDSTAAVVALSPLWQQNFDPSPLFPRLLDGIVHRGCTGVILDLTNYVTRNELVATHPAASRTEVLVGLLERLTQELAKLEEAPSRNVGDAAERVSEGVALAVSLCDALALIGDRSVVGKLYQAMEISHRRLRTEAAAALARFDEAAGRDVLVEMAAEPVARLRVLAYAEELGLLDRIDDKYQTAEARAESELALCLAQPSHFGLPPTSCELIDSIELYWPGYDDLVECFLFRYSYDFGEVSFSNIGIAGPLAHAFTADLADLSPNDIYALYAGWQAEHEDITETDAGTLSDFQQGDVVRLERRLHDSGYEMIEPELLGSFFGEKVLVAKACRDNVIGHAVVDRQDVFWYPQTQAPRALGPGGTYCIYKGKKLLRTFNA